MIGLARARERARDVVASVSVRARVLHPTPGAFSRRRGCGTTHTHTFSRGSRFPRSTPPPPPVLTSSRGAVNTRPRRTFIVVPFRSTASLAPLSLRRCRSRPYLDESHALLYAPADTHTHTHTDSVGPRNPSPRATRRGLRVRRRKYRFHSFRDCE